MAASKEDVNSGEAQQSKFAFLTNYLKPKPLTCTNVRSWYAPAVGGLSYTIFSIHIFNPNFLESLFPRSRYMVANALLFNSHLGCVLYLTNSKHLSSTTIQHRVMYGLYGALLFNFGSVLLWAVTKSILPEDGYVRTVFSISSSVCMLLIGREYIHHVDNWCNKKH